jgi:WD40 repeat protein
MNRRVPQIGCLTVVVALTACAQTQSALPLTSTQPNADLTDTRPLRPSHLTLTAISQRPRYTNTPLPTAGPTPTLAPTLPYGPPPLPTGFPAGLVLALEESPDIWTLWISETDGSESWFGQFTSRIEATNFYLWPDMSQLIIMVDGDLWSMDLQFGERKRLTDTPDVDEYPLRQWPEGEDSLLVTAYTSPFTGSFVKVSLDGGYEEVREHDWLHYYDLSTDGSTLAYGTGDLAYLETIGVEPTLFDFEKFGLFGVTGAGNPSFSPDGNKLVWTISLKDRADSVNIIVFDLKQHTHTIIADYQPVGSDRPPSPSIFSRDSSRLAFVEVTPDENKSGVYVADLATGNLRRLTNYWPEWYAFSWSPDGNWVAEIDADTRIRFVYTGDWSESVWDTPFRIRAVAWVER